MIVFLAACRPVSYDHFSLEVRLDGHCDTILMSVDQQALFWSFPKTDINRQYMIGCTAIQEKSAAVDVIETVMVKDTVNAETHIIKVSSNAFALKEGLEITAGNTENRKISLRLIESFPRQTSENRCFGGACCQSTCNYVVCCVGVQSCKDDACTCVPACGQEWTLPSLREMTRLFSREKLELVVR